MTKYTWIRITNDAKKELDERLRKINNEELKAIGLRNSKVHQIDLTKFLFKNKIFISNSELKEMARKKWGGRVC